MNRLKSLYSLVSFVVNGFFRISAAKIFLIRDHPRDSAVKGSFSSSSVPPRFKGFAFFNFGRCLLIL